jgi:predicted metal-dependent HD superfamily phosphohydrolase
MEREIAESEPQVRPLFLPEWKRAILPNVPVEKQQLAEFFLEHTVKAYSGEGRYYHNLAHINFCFKKLAPYRDRTDYPELFLGILWHDLVYHIYSQTNEEESGQAAQDFMRALELPHAETVHRLIVSTKHHSPEREDERLVCAVDLAILAEPWPTYELYAQKIRQEYADYSDEEYSVGRVAVLGVMKAGDGPFRHPDFLHLNDQAKANMEQETMLLRQAHEQRA